MTLINLITFDKGTVIAADKRGTDSNRGSIDELTKIVPIGKNGAVGLWGGPRFLDPVTYEVQFDAFKEFEEYFQHNEFSEIEVMKAVDHVIKAFRAFVQKYQPEGYHPRSLGVFSAVVLIHASGDIKHLEMPFCMKDPMTLGFGRATTFHHDSRLHCFGDIALFNELKDGNDSRFNEIRANDDIRRFVAYKHPPARQTVSEREAIEFCRFFIELNSSNIAQVSGEESISPTCDVAVIDDAGFHWV